ncbi:hypothetical protein BO94DRAFT_536859 [Aspergillus sclerotioniger CBS 115572]|uniref:Uncharacterized protein n=1 Tax=Aspergillus sclerotioniger CBS 115572 TaxID=1450535 RepID=A0A317W8M9_9EURO|nr:hypothetical protein BO94DRAFT_536859 [Aspergillus sclerotioniger CBS 115572]PWY81592.1 hypothetical protein BO94DRAFT_536859 [Aspergillus sclerotioniger CBS 115572]
MATTTTTSVRYSTGKVATSESAKAFPWEAPIPVDPFWDSFEYCTARSFLSNFTDDELAKLPIDAYSTADHQTKLGLLLQLLNDKLTQEEAATSPPQSLYEADYKRWYSLWSGIFTIQNNLNLPEAEQTVRMLVEKRPDPNNVDPSHMLAEYLVKVGKYEEAEETAKPVCAGMDALPRLGKDSPQALNARRFIAKAVWFQGPGRREEAEALVAELKGLVDGMGAGKFGVYQEEERRLNGEMLAELGLVA